MLDRNPSLLEICQSESKMRSANPNKEKIGLLVRKQIRSANGMVEIIEKKNKVS